MIKTFYVFVICLLPCLVWAQTPIDTANIIDIDTTGQRDLIDIGRGLLKYHEPRTNTRIRKQIYFSVLPISSSVAGSNQVLVTSTTAGFFLGPRKTTYLSSVNFAPYLNFKGRYGLPIHSSVWLRDNTYNIQGDIRFLVYPQYTWGLGGNQPEDKRILVSYSYLRFYQTALKRITPFMYIGAGYNLDDYVNITTNSPVTIADYTGYRYGSMGGSYFSTGINLDFLYDTRQNAFNPIPGSFVNVIYRHDAEMIGSNDGAQSIYIDFRKYISLTNIGLKNQLCFWSYFWDALTPGTPYLNLPSIGMDPYQRSGRGIEQSRYRGEALIYFEGEYRRDITRNGLFGFVVFANVNSASNGNTHQFTDWNPATGAGLRIKFNKKSDTNVCLDYGVSRGYSDITIALGEAF